MNTNSPTVETLLQHRPWVAALAGQLVADPSVAADLEQETWLEALRQPPRDLRNPRGWLATVLRNKARGVGRADSRRRSHETAARRGSSMGDPMGDAAEVAERAETQARLARAVLDLAEPYRTVLLLRFFDDQQPKAIAASLGRPIATVGTQIQRGLAMLREQLDSEFGDRRAWVAAIAPLAGSIAPVRVAAAGWTFIVGAAAVLLGLAAWTLTSGLSDPNPLASRQVGRVPAALEAPETPAEATPERERVKLNAPRKRVEQASGAKPSRPWFEAELRDLDGTPRPGVEIEFMDPEHPERIKPEIPGSDIEIEMGKYYVGLDPSKLHLYRTEAAIRRRLPDCPNPGALLRLLEGKPVPFPRVVTDEAGRFRIRGPESSNRLRLVDPTRMILGTLETSTGAKTLLSCPCRKVEGRVFDPLGRAVAAVRLSITVAIESLVGLRKIERTMTFFSTLERKTDVRGGFAFQRLPSHPSVALSLSKRGYQDRKITTAEIRRSVVRWTLAEDPRSERTLISGRVVDRLGQPAAASIVFGAIRHETNERGEFSFEIGKASLDHPLIAFNPGEQAAIIHDIGERLRADRKAGEQLTLRLGAAPRELRGRVVDAKGRPLAGMHLVLLDATPLGNMALQTVESHLRTSSKKEIERSNDEGRFRFDLLSNRPYRIRAVHPPTLLVIEGQISATATEIELRAAPQPFYPIVSGRVVDDQGAPLASVPLAVSLVLLQRQFVTVSFTSEIRTETDAAGRFQFVDVPRQHTRISVQSPAFGTLDHPLSGSNPVVVTERLLPFRVTTAETSKANAMEILDASGKAPGCG